MPKFKWIFPLFIAGLIVSCAQSTPTQTAANPLDESFNLLVNLNGKLELKRAGWSEYHPITFGTILYTGDLLRLDENARALVLCANLKLWNVPSGAPSGLTNGCPAESEPVLRRGASQIGNTRGGSDPNIPYIISPRATRLLSNTPILRWNKVPGVSSYTVRISGEGVDWKEITGETSLTYPGDPALKSEVVYLLSIVADNETKSEDEGLPGLGFRLVSPSDAQRISSNINKLAAMKLPDDAYALAISRYFASEGLINEAIDTLESEIKINKQSTALYLTLGELYQKIGLHMLAKESYTKAVKLAEKSDDIEMLATVYAGLGDVTSALGEQDAAQEWFSQAVENYKRLDATEQVQAIEQKMQTVTP